MITLELVSLDGVMGSAEERASVYPNDEMEASNAGEIATSGAPLLERVTYEQFAVYWPHQSDDNPMADYIYSVPKFIDSTALEEAKWHNSTLIISNIIET